MHFPRKTATVALVAALAIATLTVGPLGPDSLRAAVSDPPADVVYRSMGSSNGASAPNHRYGASAWSAEAELPDSGSPIRSIRIAPSPLAASERMVVVQGDDGWLDAYACATSCSVTNDIGQVWSSAPATLQRRFDIAYEQSSGHGLLVYGVLSSNTTRDLAYRTFEGGAWSEERYVDDPGEPSSVQYSLVILAARGGSDQIGLLGGDSTNSHVNAWIWDGHGFGSHAEITANAQSPNRERSAIAWETGSGHLLALAVDANAQNEIVWREYTTRWSSAANHVCGGPGNILRWLSLKPNPSRTASDMVLATGDDGRELGTCYWTGSGWSARVAQDGSLDGTSTRPFDFGWEATGDVGLLVFGTVAGEITYRRFAAPNSWGDATSVPMGANPHAWVRLRTNPAPSAGAPRILGVVLEQASNALGAVSWNDTGFAVLGANTFTGNAGSATYESFDLEFRIAEAPGTGPGGGDPPGGPASLPSLDATVLLIVATIAGMAAFALVGVRTLKRRRGGSNAPPPPDDLFGTGEPPPPEDFDGNPGP